jgi:hypothetical protein
MSDYVILDLSFSMIEVHNVVWIFNPTISTWNFLEKIDLGAKCLLARCRLSNIALFVLGIVTIFVLLLVNGIICRHHLLLCRSFQL